MKMLLFVAITLCTSQAIFFGITGKPFCFDIDQQPGKTIKFSYEVTGDSAHQTQAHIISTDKKVRLSLAGSTNKTEQSIDSTLKICFVSTDGSYKSVSIYFYTHDKANLLELAKKSHIYELHSKIIEVGQKFKQITKNQVFEQERDITQSRIINKQSSIIKFFGSVKFVLIIVVVGCQGFLLKKMLQKRPGYEPV